MVYKDECCRCFATPKSENGLDVCLKCFVGSCHNSEYSHSSIHFKNTSHSLVVRIFKTPKPDTEQKKVTKLAIGLPGGIDADTDKFETSVKVYCHACDCFIDHTIPEVASIVDSILLAQSAYEAQAVGEWELQIQPCEHTLCLDQSGS